MVMEKRIFKSNRNKVLTGTCGGLGEYFNIDPTIVRLIFVAICFAGGSGLFIYIIAALIIPNTPADDFDDFETMDRANKNYHAKPRNKNKIKTEDEDFDSYFEK